MKVRLFLGKPRTLWVVLSLLVTLRIWPARIPKTGVVYRHPFWSSVTGVWGIG